MFINIFIANCVTFMVVIIVYHSLQEKGIVFCLKNIEKWILLRFCLKTQITPSPYFSKGVILNFD